MDNVKREFGIYNSIVIENVRITPKSLIIFNPYEGQEYKAKIVLQNIGKNAVSVRILNASSSSVVLEPILSARFLASGLKIVREVEYKVVMATLIKTCSIPIHINASKYLFEITVEQYQTQLRIEPQFLNFGVVDTGPSPARRRITFYNDGLQAVRFHIDLGPNELNIMIEPMKGLIFAKSSMEVRVDLIILKEGTYSSEFWVISGAPICMKLTVKACRGRIETQSRFNMKSFKFLHFPITYCGLTSRKIILLKNASQFQSIFCITGMKQMNIFHVGEGPKVDQDYYQFSVTPKQGRLFENDVRVFTFTFAPQQRYTTGEGYSLVMMRINKVFCRDLNPDDYDGEIFCNLMRTSSTISRGTFDMESNTFDDFFDFDEDAEEETPFGSTETTTNGVDDYVNVMLYGTAEMPNVLITPNELVLRNLDIKVPVKRVLNLKNCSRNLPIILRYRKIAFVAVEPTLVTINARQSLEVTLTVTPQSYHILTTAVRFDMLHYDQPRKDRRLQKIGEVSVPITIHENIVTVSVKDPEIYARTYSFPKGTPQPRKDIYERLMNENPILGLPDDRPKGLRPWKSATNCKTIYAELPRISKLVSEFQFNDKEIALRNESKDYYHRFIRNYAMKRKIDKQASNESIYAKKLLCYPMNTKNVQNVIEIQCTDFVPLTPQQLLNINIDPRNQYIDHIVPKSMLKIMIKVKNDNGIDLRLFLKPQKHQYYRIPDGPRFVVHKYNSLDLTYYIYAHLIGLQNYRLDIIVNECHVFETTVTVNIVQAMLLITPSELTFATGDRPYKFIEFYNNLNQDIPFEWISTDDFTLDPIDGIVESQNKLACLIGLDQRKVQGHPYGMYELLIKVGGKHLTYRIKVEETNIEFLLTNRISFGVVPIGMASSRYLPLQNCCKMPVAFQLTNLEYLTQGITVEPTEGVLWPKFVKWLKVTINLPAESTFECALIINFGDVTTQQVIIEGSGKFPKIIIDEQLAFRKIAASSFDIKKLSLRNVSQVPAIVTFKTEKLSELYVREQEDVHYFMSNNTKFIKPKTATCFFIHYHPNYPEVKYFHLPMSVNGVQSQTTKKDKSDNSLVPSLRIYTHTYPHKLLISSWSYFFRSLDHAQNETINEHEVSISNTPYSTLKLCLRLDSVQAPFEILDIQGGTIIMQHEFSLTVEITDADAPFSFKVKFCPIEYGKYEMRIPVYIKGDYNEDVHNYLYFSGTYYQPEFIVSDEVINFGYIPLDFKIVKTVKAKLKYHRPCCTMTMNCDNQNITLSCENNESNEDYRTIKIQYHCASINILDCCLNMRCTCDGCSEILMLGGAENTYLTIYNCVEYLRYKYEVDVYIDQSSNNLESDILRDESVSHLKIDLREDTEYVYNTEFPFFPTGNNSFTNYFYRVIDVVEMWVCQQGFFGRKHYTIPTGFSRYEIIESKERNLIVLPFCTLFCNICAINREHFDLFCDVEANAYLTIYKFYGEMLDIMQSLGGMVNYIKAESLLPYESYIEYSKKYHSAQKLYSVERFYLWSKQSWLHLILQTYKVFVLQRLIKLNPKEEREYNLIRTFKSFHSMHSTPNLGGASSTTTNAYQTELHFIIEWVNSDYNETKAKFMGEGFINHNELPEKQIKFFNEEFADGTVLAAITLTYCPYLEEHFYTLYLPPATDQQYFYNAYLVITAWDMLNISLHLKPNDITECNPILLMFLLTYLYDFLTHFRPRKEILFYAELTRTHEVEVLIVNENKSPLNYELCIFNDPQGLFRVNSNKITVPKHQSIKMIVYYTARFLQSNRAVLVCKGEISNKNGGGKFTHGQAFLLEGNTIIGPPFIELNLHSDIYTMCHKTLDFAAPYEDDCEYELYISYDLPADIDDLKLLPVRDLIQSHTLGRIQTDTPFVTSRGRQIQKRVRLCSITLNSLEIFVFARNSTVGDFYMKMGLFVRPRHNLITVMLDLSRELFHTPCTCYGKPNLDSNCPRICLVKVPCKNEMMWKGLLKYFFKYRDEDEYEFWNHYKDTPVGLHVLKRLLFDHQKYVTEDMSYIFEPRFYFSVENFSSKSVTMPTKIDMVNTLSVDQHADVLIHLNEFTPTFKFELYNEKERRSFNVFINILEDLSFTME